MKIMDSKKLIEELKRDEGVKLFPYKCSANKLTIGVGRNIEERGITEDEANYLLKNDLTMCVEEVESIFTWYPYLTDSRKRVIVNMVFNLGLSRFLNFKKFIDAMEQKDYETAGKEMLDSKWAKQVGDRAKRLKQMIVEG
tara:strand:- start:2476 stop:2895 length:420 start_codon:yes stop_codon:yes gene_type:complete